MSTYEETWRRAVNDLRAADHVVVFTGAGVSQESGIPTFRDDDGLWSRFPPEQYGRWDQLLKLARDQPAELAEFVGEVVGPIAAALPNAGHAAIAELQQHVQTTVITQNIDGLHEEAGSQTVHAVHGSMLEVVSLHSGKPLRTLVRNDLVRLKERLQAVGNATFGAVALLRALSPILGMGVHGVYRPSLVLFNEGLREPAWSSARTSVETCDVWLSVGTSGIVWPAAELPLLAADRRCPVYRIDTADQGDPAVLYGRASEVLPRLISVAFG